MKKTGKCPKCESTNIIPEAKIIAQEAMDAAIPIFTLKARVVRHPHAMIFEKPEHTVLKAWICGNCGYTEIYADDPQRLHDTHLEAQAERKKNGW